MMLTLSHNLKTIKHINKEQLISTQNLIEALIDATSHMDKTLLGTKDLLMIWASGFQYMSLR